MKYLVSILLFLKVVILFGQTNLLPVVSWQTNVTNVEQLTDSTYRFDVMPIDWNEPGAATMQYGNYFQDYAGNTYEVIDSAYLSVTVLDVFETGVSPQVNQVGIMFQSPDSSKYLAPIKYQKLDQSALDNARARELAYLWRQAYMYENDSAKLIQWSDTLIDIGTKYDLDTLHQKTIDSIFHHREEIDLLKNQSDSLASITPATTLQAQTGLDNINYITSLTAAEQLMLNSVPYYGAKEDLHMQGRKILVDSIITEALRSMVDSIILYGNLWVTDTTKTKRLQLTGSGFTEGHYLKIAANGAIVGNPITGALVYKGVWIPATNTPALVDGTGTNGDFYRVFTDGDTITIDLGSGNIDFENGSDVIYNGSTWQKIPNYGFILQIASASVLGGVKIGDNILIDEDGKISIEKQTLTAGSNAGELTISEGNTVTININDADHDPDNENQDLGWNSATGDITISNGEGTNIDGRYTLLIDWQDSINYFLNRFLEQSDSILDLIEENEIQRDSIQLLSDSLSYYVLKSIYDARVADISDSLFNAYVRDSIQSDSILANADSIDALAALIEALEELTTIADAVEAQAGLSNSLMTVVRVAEQLSLNAVPYWKPKEDIYSDYDMTVDSIFATNHYLTDIKNPVELSTGVYTKDYSTNLIEVYVNGVLQTEMTNYTQDATTVTILKMIPTDIITIKYKYQ